MDLSARYKKVNSQLKNFPADEESDTQKEKGKQESEEQEKYYTRNYTIANSLFQLSGEDKVICYSTKLNIHPCQDHDIQPPKLFKLSS